MDAGAQQQNESEIEKLAKLYQTVQEQLRVFAMQLDQLKSQQIDLERATQEVAKTTGKIYLGVGGVIVESDKEKALTDIKDRSELTETRIQSLNKQYTDLKSREKQLSEKIAQIYKQGQ